MNKFFKIFVIIILCFLWTDINIKDNQTDINMAKITERYNKIHNKDKDVVIPQLKKKVDIKFSIPSINKIAATTLSVYMVYFVWLKDNKQIKKQTCK